MLSAVIPSRKLSDQPDCACGTTRENWCKWRPSLHAGAAEQQFAMIPCSKVAQLVGKVRLLVTRIAGHALGLIKRLPVLKENYLTAGRDAGASCSRAWLVQEVVVMLHKTSVSPAVFNWQRRKLSYRFTLTSLFYSPLRYFYS